MPVNPSEGELLRMAADGELTPELQASMDGRDQQSDAPRVEFERELRRRVQNAMQDVAAPEGLRDAIRRAMVEDDAGTVATPLGDTTSPSFWAGVQRFAAVAAVLLVCASLIVVAALQTRPEHAIPTEQFTQITSFVTEQHQRACSTADDEDSRFIAREDQEIADLAEHKLDGLPPVLAFSISAMRDSGYRFVGMKGCGVPGNGASVHALFRPEDDTRKPVSLFVQQDTAELDLSKSACYFADCKVTGKRSIVVWRRDGFVYYLFSHDEAGLKTGQKAFGVPDAEKPL
ncbi:MAG: hypothetical protein AAFX05_08745 [Planctomycetota bacterium]